jgi:hypothetical protein
VVSRLAVLAASTLALAACSVPPLSLDGKECPCTDGYVCDTLTNRCLATNDGGMIIDTPAATQCLPALGVETEIYRYSGPFDWAPQGGAWDGTATEIQQTDAMATAMAFRTSVDLSRANVHVLATMRQTAQGNGGTPGLGIAMRASLDGATTYRCMWSADQRRLTIERETGGSSTPIGVPATVAASATIPASFTMEAAASGSSLSCCIRELSDARVTSVTDTAIATGFSGLATNRVAAAFGSFVVFGLP